MQQKNGHTHMIKRASISWICIVDCYRKQNSKNLLVIAFTRSKSLVTIRSCAVASRTNYIERREIQMLFIFFIFTATQFSQRRPVKKVLKKISVKICCKPLSLGTSYQESKHQWSHVMLPEVHSFPRMSFRSSYFRMYIFINIFKMSQPSQFCDILKRLSTDVTLSKIKTTILKIRLLSRRLYKHDL